MPTETLRGHWWIPNEYENRVGGTLELYDEDLFRLEIFSEFGDPPYAFNNQSIKEIPKILGVTTDGREVTLINCRRDNYNDTRKQGTRNVSSVYVSSRAIVGYSFENENPAFDAVDVSFPYQEDWTRPSGLDVGFQTHQGLIDSGARFQVSFTFPDSVTGFVNDYEISLKVHGETNVTRFRGAGIDLDCRFKIDPKRPRVVVDEYLEIISKLNNFLAFATDRAIAPVEIEGEIDGNEASIYYPTEGTRNDESTVHPSSLLFHYSHISQDFSKALQTWFEISNQLKPVIDLYLGTRFNNRMYENNAFLSLSQAVESYHRFTRMGRYHSEYKYNQVLDDMVSFLCRDIGDIYNHSGSVHGSTPPTSYIGDLKTLDEMYNLDNSFINKMKDGTLKYANEYSLRRRLSELVEEHRTILENLPYNIVNRQDEVIATRNYFTHYDPGLKSRAVESGEVTKLTWGLQQIVEVALLKRIGIHPEVIENRLNFKYSRKSIS